MERWVILGVVLLSVIAVGFHKFIGGIIAALGTIGIMVWGYFIFKKGLQLTFFGTKLSLHAFYIIMGCFLLWDIFMIYKGYKQKSGN